ncbi:MAG: GNAT family N-acetyltransferase [Clostridia bacterium]|nr:GNAT family N-acetyltransferase [Clostridia bacterium]
MHEFTYLYRKNRRQFKQLKPLYADYRRQTVINHGGDDLPERVFRRELGRVLRHTDECIWSNNPRCFIVLHEGDTVIGFADIRAVSTDLLETDYPYGTVEDFCIAEEYRNKGYGRILYDRVETVLRKNGTKTILMTPDPKTGVAFWEKMGFASTDAFIPDTKSVVYRKDI